MQHIHPKNIFFYVFFLLEILEREGVKVRSIKETLGEKADA